MRMPRFIPAWAAAVVVTTLLISLSHSLMVQAELMKLGVPMPLSLKGATAGRDLEGLWPALAAVVGLGFAIAFVVAARLRRFAPALAFPLAGAVAIAAALALMRLQFDLTPIAGARTPTGQGLMVMAGLMGGMLFGRLARLR